MSAASELQAGQLILNCSPQDAAMFSTIAVLSRVCIDKGFPMLFTVFTRITKTIFESKRTHLIGDQKRVERLAKNVDKFGEWERNRRRRWQRQREAARLAEKKRQERRPETWV